MQNARRYLWMVAAGALIGGGYAAVNFVLVGSDAVANCDPGGVDATHHMAYCNVRSFTEYDLGAHYFGLEPDSIMSLKKAEVQFLGNSRTGHTFSSEATASFMRARRVP